MEIYHMEKNLSFLTKKQRKAYMLKQEGNTFQKIAEIMNTSTNLAQKYVLMAEKRIIKYNRFNAIKEKYKIPLQLDINSEELKLIIRALIDLYFVVEADLNHNIKSDWNEQFQYEYDVIIGLLDRIYLINDNINKKEN